MTNQWRPGKHHFHPFTGFCFICGMHDEVVLGFKCVEPPYPVTEERLKKYSDEFADFWRQAHSGSQR